MAFGDSTTSVEAFADSSRWEIVLVGLYRALRLALTFDVSWLLLTPQSMISGYAYPNALVDQAVAEVQKLPEPSERNGVKAETVRRCL